MATTFHSVAPVLPSRDFDATIAFYDKLGFAEAGRYPDYLILRRDRAEMHFGLWVVDPKETDAGAYLRVDGIDDLAAAFGQSAEDKPWRQREFCLIDPDGTLLRFGEAVSVAE
jgi:catechol 2,3-dioxygenase-like lactoylglutathione lyase family enzyme